MDIEKLTSMEQLRDDQKILAETIGLEAYKKLVVNYAGKFKCLHSLEHLTSSIAVTASPKFAAQASKLCIPISLSLSACKYLIIV